MILSDTTAGTANGKDQVDHRPYMAQRGIGFLTLREAGVRQSTDLFPQFQGASSGSIRFKYREGYKARAIPHKAFVCSKDFKTSFWNEDRVLQAQPSVVYVTEGEMDAVSLIEAGISANSVLSVPTGARDEPSKDPYSCKGYEYVKTALMNGLNNVGKFIWCGDNDQPGIALRSDMATLLGEARFRFVEWPEGIKDANEMLVKEGGAALLELVRDGSLEWPVDGLYAINEIPNPPSLTLWDMGFGWGPRIKLAQRTLSVVTGWPGSGKTVAFAQMFYNIVRQYQVPACIGSFETRPKPHYHRILRQLYNKKLEQFQSVEELKLADEWINGWYRFLIHYEERPTLKWILDKAEVAVVRHGARIIQIDPWNRVEGMRQKDENQTDYILRCLRELHLFAHDMNCHVQIVAHPSKLDSTRRGFAPTLEDIIGSSHWNNIVDQGFCIHREKKWEGMERRTDATLYHLKSRFSELGWPCEVKINFNLSTESYESLEKRY